MKSFWIWIIAMLVWIIIGWWLCSKYLCAPAAPAGTCNTLSISDVNDFKADINRNVNFLRSNHNHLNNYAVVGNAMNQVANYLSGDATRKLDVTGFYDTTETNSNTAFTNLGLARADDVRSWLISLGTPGNQIITSYSESDNCYAGDTLQRGVAFEFSGI